MITKRRFDLPDLLFGVFLVLVAAGTLAATWKLRGGTAADMGPGYMPRAIALALMGFGLFFAGRGASKAYVGLEEIQLRPILAIVVAVAAFALLADRAGLALASLVTIVIAAFATREARPVEVIAFGTAMAAAAVLLFVKVLALPVPVWPW